MKEIKITLRIDAAMLEKLDDMRRVEKDVPTRSEMVRRLIERADVAPVATKPRKA